MTSFTSILLLALTIARCPGFIIDDVADLNKLNLKFDFIFPAEMLIVTAAAGATAGNVIANRLSDNPNYSVLFLEAGGLNADVLDIIIPFYCVPVTPNTAQDWNYTTTPLNTLPSGIRP
ncbi:hypothetical protein DFH09DRAFT_1377036 [Mycena vulgaris]|nr:hypothetical protein DFH09DRAFT_1377036 [Mycena vulgaris]